MAHAVGVRQARWRGTVASLDQVAPHLGRLTRELAASEGDPHPGSTACCLDLVVRVGDDPVVAGRVTDVIGQLAPSHPLRAVVVRTRDRAGAIEAEVLCETYGRGVQRQELLLTLPPAATTRLAEQVSAVLAPGVPVYVWSVLPPDLTDPEGIDALGVAAALIVDTAALDDAVTVAGDLRRLAARGRTAVGDLSWARLRRWREALASFFAPPDRRSLIDQIERLDVEHGAGAAATMESALLVGWLVSRLGYALDGVDGGAEAVVARYRGGAGRRIRVQLAAAGGDGGLGAVEMRGPGFRLGVRADGEAGAEVRFTIQRTVTQRVCWTVPTEAQLLGELLVDATHDLVYPAALAAAVDLLEARR